MTNKKPDNSRPLLYVLLKKYGLKGALQIVKDDVGFDLINRTNTAAPVGQRRLFSAAHNHHQNRYVASTFGVLEGIFTEVAKHIDLSESGFVDLGSGKGKVLISACSYNFKSIRGIEVSELMHSVATANLKKLQMENRVQLLNASAASVMLQPHERVVYFFNSFTGDVLEECLLNMTNVIRDGQGILVYVNPTEHNHVLRHFPLLHSEFIQPGNCEVNYYSLPSQ